MSERTKEGSMVLMFLMFVVITLVTSEGCSYINRKAGLDDENFLEEFAEQQLYEATGLDVDFTPSSKEDVDKEH